MKLSEKQKAGIKTAIVALAAAFIEKYSGILERVADFLLALF